MIPFLPGFAAVFGAKIILNGAIKLFDLGSLIQTILAALFYYFFCLLFPPQGGIAEKWNGVEPGDDFILRVYLEIDGVSFDLEKTDVEKEIAVASGVDFKS